LAFCARWAETSSRYALCYLPSHLQEQGRTADLIELGRNEKFFQSVRQVLPLELKLPLRTAALALRAAVAANGTPTTAALLLVHARECRAIALASPLELAVNGRVETAWHVMDVLDVHLATLWHLLIAWDLRERGQLDLARETLVRLSRPSLPSFEGWDIDDFVPLLVEVALLDDEIFLRLLAALVPEDYVARVNVLERLAAKGYWQLAIRGACENPDENLRLYTFEVILAATPSTATGVAGAVEDAVSNFKDVGLRARALARVGQRRGQLEGTDVAAPYFARARGMVTESPTDAEAVYARAMIALREVRAGIVPAADHVRDVVEGARAFDETARETYAGSLADTLAEIGESSAAMDLLEGMADPDARDEASAAVAARLAARGDTAAASIIIATMADPLARVKAFAASSGERGDAKDLVGGRQLFEAGYADAARLDMDGRADVMATLCASSYVRRNPELAAAVLDQLEGALPPSSGIDDVWRCMALAHLRSAAGSAERAVEALLQAIDTTARQASEGLSEELVPSLCRAALVCARPDLVVQLTERLRSIRDAWWEDGNFGGAVALDGQIEQIPPALADAGEFEHATRIAEWVRQGRAQARAFSAVAARQARGERAEARATYAQALRTHQHLVHDGDAKRAEQTLADVQAHIIEDARQRGDHERSLAMVHRILGAGRVYQLAAEALWRASADPSRRPSTTQKNAMVSGTGSPRAKPSIICSPRRK
jgi:hypothetical protein